MKSNTREQLTTKQKRFARSIFRDPVLFATHVLGVDLWEREVELLRSIEKHRRTAIRACHAVGKTFTLAVATLWWLTRHQEGIVLTTSPTQRQVRTQLWAEIHRLAERARVPYPVLQSTEVKLRGKDNFAIGFSTNLGENFQGYHGKQVLIVADEAPGIESGIWDAIAGTMAGGVVHIIMAGNPTIPSGAFFDAFTQERSLWNCLCIGAFDSPNLRGLELDQLLQLDPRDGGPLDHNPFLFLVTRRWVYEQYQLWWHGSDANSPNWLSRVLARFPDQAEGALIKLSWLERARRRAVADPVVDTGQCSLVAGVDVGGGESETVVFICECTTAGSRIIAMNAWRGDDTRGAALNFLSPYRARLYAVRVDSVGIGHGFAQHLQDHRLPVEFVNVGMACEANPNLGANDPARRFANLKGCYYQVLADLLEQNRLDGLSDEKTIGQLAGILFEIDPQGRVRIESKEQARARGFLSPDRAEALMLALCKPPQKFEYYTLSNPPLGFHSSSRDSQHYSYAREDDGDLPPNLRRVRNRFDVFAKGGLADYFRRRRGGW